MADTRLTGARAESPAERLPTVLSMRHAPLPPLPARFAVDDVRFAPEFARLMIARFTRPGQLVFDPFAGFGTTLTAARAWSCCPSAPSSYARSSTARRACTATTRGNWASWSCRASTSC